MRRFLYRLIAVAILPFPAIAAAEPVAAPLLTPNDIVAAAPASDWTRIAPTDLVVMDLAPDALGRHRRVVIQLMPAPFSQGWVENVRKLVAAHWYDGIAVVRVQDNYVVQWGDPDGETPGKAKALPAGLETTTEAQYVAAGADAELGGQISSLSIDDTGAQVERYSFDGQHFFNLIEIGAYGLSGLWDGWPVSKEIKGKGRHQNVSMWPVHCYGMVGVGRGLSPDAGTGAELYTVIGQAPRQLDRNIALVGRVIEGIEHLSSLPRGTGALGFYETAQERTPIVSVRMGSEVADLPPYEYLSTESASFAAYADKRANRKDDFYIQPAGGVDVCNVPVPVRRVGATVKAAGK